MAEYNDDFIKWDIICHQETLKVDGILLTAFNP